MPMAEASKILSKWWKSESQDVRTRWELEAERLKLEHKKAYPGYRFQPKSKSQKLREKTAKKEAVRKAQLLKQKTKTRASTPPRPYATSTATSYLAAAMAYQAKEAVKSPLPPSTFGSEGPSPPPSQLGTPHSTPSPYNVSDFEQGSSSTSATSYTLPSPSDALGLALPSSLTFAGQDEASALVPSRGPPRLPPRPRGKKMQSETSLSSVNTASSGVTVRAESPATGTPSALSPLPWTMSAGGAPPPQGLPRPRDFSPSTAPAASTTASPQPWQHSTLYDVPQESTEGLAHDLVRTPFILAQQQVLTSNDIGADNPRFIQRAILHRSGHSSSCLRERWSFQYIRSTLYGQRAT
jgi:hypothetical protein